LSRLLYAYSLCFDISSPYRIEAKDRPAKSLQIPAP
jgi:hypothetical protein